MTGDKPVIAYCRIGERSSHTWFVLKYLLGFKNVKNYDGSWTEWGNLVGARGRETVADRCESLRSVAVKSCLAIAVLYVDHETRRLLATAGGAGRLADCDRDLQARRGVSLHDLERGSRARASRAPTGATKEEAEQRALEKAERYLAQTRRFPTRPDSVAMHDASTDSPRTRVAAPAVALLARRRAETCSRRARTPLARADRAGRRARSAARARRRIVAAGEQPGDRGDLLERAGARPSVAAPAAARRSPSSRAS